MQSSTELVRVLGLGAAIVGLSSATLLSVGCNIVGPAGFLIAGEEKVSARFTLPAEKPTVVFVDDRSSVLPSRNARTRIAQAVERTLLDGGAVPKGDILSSEGISQLAAGERFSRPAGIAEIGESVKADVVVYATIDAFSLSIDGQQFTPAATARVKVIDVKTKKRLWPEAPEEWSVVSLTMPTKQGSIPTKISDRADVEQELADRLGVMIGRLFVKHVGRDPNPRIGS